MYVSKPMLRIIVIVGIVELAIIAGLAIYGVVAIAKKYKRSKDSRLFDLIRNYDFDFSHPNLVYKNYKYILGNYINAYIIYGHNVKCNLTEQEFKQRLFKFIRDFNTYYGKYDDIREEYTLRILNSIYIAVSDAIKVSDFGSVERAKELMDYLEKISRDNRVWNRDEEVTEMIKEVLLLINTVTED